MAVTVHVFAGGAREVLVGLDSRYGGTEQQAKSRPGCEQDTMSSVQTRDQGRAAQELYRGCSTARRASDGHVAAPRLCDSHWNCALLNADPGGNTYDISDLRNTRCAANTGATVRNAGYEDIFTGPATVRSPATALAVGYWTTIDTYRLSRQPDYLRRLFPTIPTTYFLR
jgi:hypothetical protein